MVANELVSRLADIDVGDTSDGSDDISDITRGEDETMHYVRGIGPLYR